MKRFLPLVAAVIVALAAVALAWQKNHAYEEAHAALTEATGQLQKAQAELKSLNAEIAPLRKEFSDLKMSSEQQRVELSAATAFLETERAATARVRDELAKAKEQIDFMRNSRAAQTAPNFPAPVLVRPAPVPVRAVTSGSAERNAVRAQ